MSYLLNKTVNINYKTFNINEEKDNRTIDDELINREEINEDNEITPERDLRDTQPTVSVNYRVIKSNREYELNQKDQKANDRDYNDDWGKNKSEW